MTGRTVALLFLGGATVSFGIWQHSVAAGFWMFVVLNIAAELVQRGRR